MYIDKKDEKERKEGNLTKGRKESGNWQEVGQLGTDKSHTILGVHIMHVSMRAMKR